MTGLEMDQWELGFRAAAQSDDYAIFRDHLKRLGLSGTPESLLEDTIMMVNAMAAYLNMNGNKQPIQQFFQMQTYDPAMAVGAAYAFMFDVGGMGHARLMVDKETRTIDLADLFEHPWDKYRKGGYSNLYISHIDWRDLTCDDIKYLDDVVSDDLGFDYSWEEVAFTQVDTADDCTYLHLFVYEGTPEERVETTEVDPET